MRNLFTGRRKVRLPLARDTYVLSQQRPKSVIFRTGLMIGGASLGGFALFAFLAMGPLAPNGSEDGTAAILAPEIATSQTADPVEGGQDIASTEMTSADETAPRSAGEAQESVAVAKSEAGGSDNRQQRAVTTAAEMPAANDPRWGDIDQRPATSVQSQDSDLGRALSALGQIEPQSQDAASAFSGLLETENGHVTASAPVQVAESEDDIFALEEMQRQENAMLLASLGENSASYTRAGTGVPATVTAYVNMRDAPNNDSNVIAVVPANAQIESSQECLLQWCEVTYQGQSGYIYQGYVQHAAR